MTCLMNKEEIKPTNEKYYQMKSIIIKYILILFILINGSMAMGQLPMSLYYLKNVPQSNMLNPAKDPRPNFFIGVPMVNFLTSYQSDMPLVDFIQVGSDGIPYVPLNENYDFDKLYNQIGDGVNFQINQNIVPLMFGWRFKKGYFTFSFSEKINMSYGLPKGFFSLIDEGSPVGSTTSLEGLSIENYVYHEFSFGYSREINDKLSVAARVKPMFGVAAVKTEFDELNITTTQNSDNQIVKTINANAHILASIPGVKDENITYDEDGLPSDVEIDDFETDFVIDNALSFSNPGVAIDLGATYDLDLRWSFSAALNNIGSIKWKDNLQTLSFQGGYDYAGVIINDDNIDNEQQISEDNIDSLLAGIDITHGKRTFKSGPNPTLYVGAEYNVNHVFSLGFLSRSIFQKDFFRQDFDLSANLNLYHRLSTSVDYNIDIKGNSFVGFGMASFIGPLQIYLMVDKIPVFYRNYVIDGSEIPIPGNLQNATFMFGMNFVFGAKGFRDKPMLSLKNR